MFGSQCLQQVTQRTREAPNGVAEVSEAVDLATSKESDRGVLAEIAEKRFEGPGADFGVGIQEQHERGIDRLEAPIVAVRETSVLIPHHPGVWKPPLDDVHRGIG